MSLIRKAKEGIKSGLKKAIELTDKIPEVELTVKNGQEQTQPAHLNSDSNLIAPTIAPLIINEQPSVPLSKGQNINLSAEVIGLTKIDVGLGWDVSGFGGRLVLTSVAFMLNASNKVLGEGYVVHANQSKSPCHSLSFNSNVKGKYGEHESITVDLSKVPADCTVISFVVTIVNGMERKQNFTMIENSFINTVNDINRSEVTRYNLEKESSPIITMILGELYRHNGHWKFRAIGQGSVNGLKDIATNFGANHL